ncbi:MAG: tandem-95 repeat protein [Actinobacteria bacterium]|nr:tandem-95 repeat protein [Actinomycetota bacterium]
MPTATRATPVARRSVTATVVLALFAPLVAVLGLTLGASPASAATCASANIGVTKLHGPVFYVDFSPSPPTNPKLVGQYAGFKITNSTGAALNGAWVKIDSLTPSSSGGVLSLGSGETGMDQLKDLAAGGTDNSYFYLTASAATTTAQSFTVRVFDRKPTLAGATELCSTTSTYTQVVQTTDAAANKVTTSVATSNPPGIGALMTMTVQGSTGTIGSGDSTLDPSVFATSPATYVDWPAGAFRLEKVEVDLDITNRSAVGQPANYDYLWYRMATAATSNRDYTLVFTFRIIGTTSASTSMSPIQEIASGTQTKHTDVSNYSSIAPITPPTNRTSITLAVSPTTLPAAGGTVTYTATIANTDTTQDMSLDDITNTLPTGVSYVSGSATFNGSAIADPATSGSTQTWVRTFAVPAASSRTLTFRATVPGTRGAYVDSLVGHTGATQIDTTTDTSDSSPATATATVVNTPPVAATDAYTATSGATLTVSAPGVLANDTDANGDTLTVTANGNPSHGTASVSSTGAVTYTATANYTGADSFTYTVSDGFGGSAVGTVNLTVRAAAVANNDSASVYSGGTVDVPVLTNDTVDTAYSKSVSAVGAAAHGTAVANADGTITYTPAPGYTGGDSFTYTLSDGNGRTATATVTVTVRARPVASADSATVYVGATVDVSVLANDTVDGGLSKSVTGVSTPSNGTATVNGDGTVTYAPAPGYTGGDSFSYTLSDGTLTSTATVTVTVRARPSAADDSASVYAGDSVTVEVLGNDTVDAGLAKSVTAATTPGNGTAVVNGDGTITYTPAPGFTGSDSFDYTLSDGTRTATARVTVAVRAQPSAGDDAVSLHTGSSVDISVLANDTVDAGFSRAVTGATTPANGTAVVNGDGTITYTPAPGFTGSDSFDYTLSDGTRTATATVSVTVWAAPVATGDSATTDMATAVTVDVLANDSVDPSLTASVDSVGTPGNGTALVNGDGTITYTPDAGFSGTDSFTYTLSDGAGSTDTATVSVTVRPPAPVAVNDTATGTYGQTLTVAAPGVLSNDSGTAVTAALSTAPAASAGSATVAADGSWTFTPAVGFVGTASFSYTITDGFGRTSTATVTVTVPRPAAPRACGAGWQFNGTASARAGCQLFLTPATSYVAGTAFWPTPQPTTKIAKVTFDMTMGQGTGADGIALVFADPARGATPTTVGGNGGRLGIGSVAATVARFDTFRNPNDPFTGFVGLCTMGTAAKAPFVCPKTAAAPSPLRSATSLVTHRVVVTLGMYFNQPYLASISVDGITLVTGNVTVPRSALFGFSAATGEWNDTQYVSNVTITYRP